MARPKADIQERIVHAARALFLQQGVDGASLRQIATDAGTNIGMIYYYFKTKDDLFLGVVEEVYAKISADVQAIAESAHPIEQRLTQLYLRLADQSAAETQVLQLILREAMVSSERLQRVAARFQAGHLPVVANMMMQGMQEGRLRSDLNPLAVMAATFLLGILPQLAHRRVTATGLPIAAVLPGTQEAAHMMLDVLFHGIAGPKHERSTGTPRS